jgi:REP element-mobilizing transposase RayT
MRANHPHRPSARAASTKRPRARTPRSRAESQLTLNFPSTWGGRRRGAGRPPSPGRSPTPHRARPDHKARHPVHVTLRSAFRPLRSQHVLPTLRIALGRANRRDPERFRILHYSVQFDHLHLVVEASDKRALSSGVRSIAIRVARYVNELVGRKGALWSDRWFGRELTTPRQVRNAIMYVLANFRKHASSRLRAGVDPFSSALEFDGWQGFSLGTGRSPPCAGRTIPRGPNEYGETSEPREWLARRGWRARGLLRIDEAPNDRRTREGASGVEKGIKP